MAGLLPTIPVELMRAKVCGVEVIPKLTGFYLNPFVQRILNLSTK
jgi:hypothetical protein